MRVSATLIKWFLSEVVLSVFSLSNDSPGRVEEEVETVEGVREGVREGLIPLPLVVIFHPGVTLPIEVVVVTPLLGPPILFPGLAGT